MDNLPFIDYFPAYLNLHVFRGFSSKPDCRRAHQICMSTIPGWWFQTFFIFHNMWDVILPFDFHIFQDGYCTNQIQSGLHVIRESPNGCSSSLWSWHDLKKTQFIGEPIPRSPDMIFLVTNPTISHCILIKSQFFKYFQVLPCYPPFFDRFWVSQMWFPQMPTKVLSDRRGKLSCTGCVHRSTLLIRDLRYFNIWTPLLSVVLPCFARELPGFNKSCSPINEWISIGQPCSDPLDQILWLKTKPVKPFTMHQDLRMFSWWVSYIIPTD